MQAPVLTYARHPSTPTLRLPPLACDSHVHVFGPAARFPWAADRSFTPVDAPKEMLFALHRHLGITRCVIVQSVMHGLDNRVVQEAIQAGQGRYLGIALVRPDVADAELLRLAEAGFRGVRFNFTHANATAAHVDEVMRLTPRLQAVGMHVQVQMEHGLIQALAIALLRSVVPVVLDHMARVQAHEGFAHPDIAALRSLLAHPRFHVKLSGVDRIDGIPPYTHGLAIARQLLASHPEQCVWGTDWPHPGHNHEPDDGALVNALAHIAPSTTALTQLLVDNPQRLYRFSD